MKKLFFLFFAVFLFACNTKNYNTAYQDYYKNQRIYINSILSDNKSQEISALKKLIKCGEYLNFNVNDYKQKLLQLTPKKQLTQKKQIQKEYIKIISFNPLKIKTSHPYKLYNLKNKKHYITLINLYYAITPKPFIEKRLNNKITLKIAQYNKNITRIVYYSKTPLKPSIKKSNNLLIINPNLKQNKTKQKKQHTIKSKKTTPKKSQKPKKAYIPAIPKIPLISSSQKIIVIDPGHGGKDTGGIGIGRKLEKTAVLEIAKKVKYYLQKEGYKVFLTRNGDYFISLQNRTHFANIKKASLFISIHCNIAPKHIHSPHGIETYFLSPTRSKRAIRVAKIENKEVKGLNYLDQSVILNFLNKDRIIASNKLGIDVQGHILLDLRKHYGDVKDGGVRPAPFWVLVGTQMPAILIETGYLTNPTEAKRLFNPLYQEDLAKGIANGVKAYFIKNH